MIASPNRDKANINLVKAYTDQIQAVTKQVEGLYESGLCAPRLVFGLTNSFQGDTKKVKAISKKVIAYSK